MQATVCHVLHSMVVGGAETLAMSLAIEHSGEYRPVFALLDEVGALGHRLVDRGYKVELLGRGQGIDLRCARRLARFFRRENVELVHAHQYGPLFYSALARLFGYRPPILFQEHGRDYPDFRRPRRVWANRVLLSHRDCFVAVGHSVREALVKFEGLSRDRVEVIYNGIDIFAYDPGRSARETVRRGLGLDEDDFVIMQVARLNRLKDHGTALRALQAVRETMPRANLVLVGDGETRSALEHQCGSLGLQDFVHFVGSRSDVPTLLQGADVFLLTSISEGIPLTLIEAMATGLPCLATDVGGVSEVVLEGESGFLAQAGDHKALAGSLCDLAANPGLRARIGSAGRVRAETKFSSLTMHARYRELYRSMINSNRASDVQFPE